MRASAHFECESMPLKMFFFERLGFHELCRLLLQKKQPTGSRVVGCIGLIIHPSSPQEGQLVRQIHRPQGIITNHDLQTDASSVVVKAQTSGAP